MTAPGHLRANLYDVPVEVRISRPLAGLLGLAARPAQPVPLATPSLKPTTGRQRIRIWEINANLHCSIIGTCLSAAELRRLLGKLKIAGIEGADEHELHMLGVLLAGRPQEGAKLLQKTLDRRHHLALGQFARARDDAAIAALWDRARNGGDVAGAYWAVMTHPQSSDKLVQKVFGDIHMLSHLMGATNCADLRRMHALEEEVAALTAKLERQQAQLRDGFTTRDRTIDRLNRLLSDTVRSDAGLPRPADAADIAALKQTLGELGERLARETARRERLEQRLAVAGEANELRRRAEAERNALRQELDLIEGRLAGLYGADADRTGALDCAGTTVLYVGGRAHQIPRLRALVEQNGGRFIHHDGGIDDAAGLLPGLVSRCDVTVFPVDCVSHNAMASAKRNCRQLNKPYVPLRTSSLACLLSALAGFDRSVAATLPAD